VTAAASILDLDVVSVSKGEWRKIWQIPSSGWQVFPVYSPYPCGSSKNRHVLAPGGPESS
jgi:hypothetical protein